MAKGTKLGITQKGLTSDSMPQRLRLIYMGTVEGVIYLKGFFSTCYITSECFGKYDKLLEFIMVIQPSQFKEGTTTGIRLLERKQT